MRLSLFPVFIIKSKIALANSLDLPKASSLFFLIEIHAKRDSLGTCVFSKNQMYKELSFSMCPCVLLYCNNFSSRCSGVAYPRVYGAVIQDGKHG